MADRLDGPRAKIERSKKHVDDLESEIGQFLNQDPYRVVDHDDPDTGDTVYVCRVTADPPPHLATIFGDALHNARSALDLLAWQLVDAGDGIPRNPKDQEKIGFPISDSREKFESAGLKKIKGATSEAKTLVAATHPYKGGNDALWRLHQLDRLNKHRLLSTVGSAHTELGVHTRRFDTLEYLPDEDRWVELEGVGSVLGFEVDHIAMDYLLGPESRRYPLIDGTEIKRMTPAEREPDLDKYEFTFEVAFGQGEIAEGEPLLESAQTLVSAAEQVIESFAPLLR